MISIFKYPRTHHIESSRLQPGDEDLSSVRFSHIANRHIVVEEKVDGANSGISFSDDGQLLLQSRGHYLTGGYRERHFALFKAWANRYTAELFELLGTRYLLFGEWLYAKHTIFYTDLPHYFQEFDIYDKHTETFLSTKQRRISLEKYHFIHSVKVLFEGELQTLSELLALVTVSNFIHPNHFDILTKLCKELQLDPERVKVETDDSTDMEGLYIKVESDTEVLERYKWVRASFLTTVTNSNSHWLDRPIIPNQLKTGNTLF